MLIGGRCGAVDCGAAGGGVTGVVAGPTLGRRFAGSNFVTRGEAVEAESFNLG
jgi:hypothetical protein